MQLKSYLMSKNSDIKFFTNDAEDTLKSRFLSTLKDAKFFDILVGYFRTSGFAIMYPSLEGVEKLHAYYNKFDLIFKSE